MGHRRVKIREKEGTSWWLERQKKVRTNQICSGVFFEVKIVGLCGPEDPHSICDGELLT